MLPVILMCALMVKIAATRNVTVSLGTPKSCFFIGDNVKLICAVSSESNCCNSSRFWRDKTGTNILNDGASSDASKYEEDYDKGTTGYNLIIKNVQKSDLGTNYTCVYRFKKDVLFLSMDKICDCWECAKKDYGWSILGDLIGTVIIVIIVIVKIGKPMTVLIVGGVTFIISAVVNLFALLIGYYKCHCVDGTDPWLILLGLGTSGITGVIALIYMLKKEPTVKVPRSSYVETTGDVILECTVTSSLPITSVQWERNVDGSITTIKSNTNPNKYSGSTATTPSLTILKAESSDKGTYRCFASNFVGTGQSTTITVGKQDPASGKKSKQDGDQELNEKEKKEEKSQPLIK